MADIINIHELEQLLPLANKDKIIEIVVRNKKKKFKFFQKVALENLGDKKELQELQQTAGKILEGINKANKINNKSMEILEGIGKLQKLNVLLTGMNLCATCAGFIIVCKKMNAMSQQIEEVLSTIQTTNDISLDYEFNKCISEHEQMLDHRKTQDYFALDRMEKMVSREYDVLEMLVKHLLSNTINDKETILYSILTMASMLAASLKYYDEMYYFQYKDSIQTNDIWHTSHNKWTSIFDQISSNEFIQKIQDYGFLELNLSSLECDAFYLSLKDSVMGYKQEILDNQELLVILNDKDKLDAFNEEINKEFTDSIQEELNKTYSSEIKQVFNDAINKACMAY